MKPYYEEESGIIYCGDSFEVIPQLQFSDKVVCVTDPDYNATDIGRYHREYDNGMFHLPADEYKSWCEKWFLLVNKITPNMIFTPGIRNIWNYPQAKWVIAWHRPGSTCFNGTGGFNIWEPVLIYGNVGPFSEDHISRVPNNLLKDIARKHPCPKTYPVWQWLINKGVKPGYEVIDIFGGSGTTALACKKLGIKYTLIEKSEKYCQIAVERLRQSVMILS